MGYFIYFLLFDFRIFIYIEISLLCFVSSIASYSLLTWVQCSTNGNFVLELDFEPFSASFPRPTLSKYIGNGVEFLNRHLSAKLFHDKESMHPLLEFLRVHCYKGKVCLSTYSDCN